MRLHIGYRRAGRGSHPPEGADLVDGIRREFVAGNIRDDAGKVRRTQLRDARIAAAKQSAEV